MLSERVAFVLIERGGRQELGYQPSKVVLGSHNADRDLLVDGPIIALAGKPSGVLGHTRRSRAPLRPVATGRRRSSTSLSDPELRDLSTSMTR